MTGELAHGRAGWINHGCRCATCHRALLDHSRLRRAIVAHRRGREVQTRVAPSRARRHVARLVAAGWTRRGIAAAAGISERTMWRVLDGRRRRISLVTEHRLLAVG